MKQIFLFIALSFFTLFVLIPSELLARPGGGHSYSDDSGSSYDSGSSDSGSIFDDDDSEGSGGARYSGKYATTIFWALIVGIPALILIRFIIDKILEKKRKKKT